MKRTFVAGLLLLLVGCARDHVVLHGPAYYPLGGHEAPAWDVGIGYRHTGYYAAGADVIRSESHNRWDVAVHKDWRIAEGLDAQLGAINGHRLGLDLTQPWDLGLHEGGDTDLAPFVGLEWQPIREVPLLLNLTPAWFSVGLLF